MKQRGRLSCAVRKPSRVRGALIAAAAATAMLLVLAASRAPAAEDRQADRKADQAPNLDAREILRKSGDSTVAVRFKWRLYDAATGKPLYQRVVDDQDTGRRYPAFVRLANGEIVRWITLDDREGTNIAISASGNTSGFVVGEEGFILTGKNAAAGWTLPFENLREGENSRDLGIIYGLNQGSKPKGEVVALDSAKVKFLREWVPESGAPLFEATAPNLIGGDGGRGRPADRRAFLGKQDFLEVRFPGGRIGAPATVVRTSADADAVLIKIEAVQTLHSLELAPEAEDGTIEVGDRVIVLTYPGPDETLPTIQSDSAIVNITPEPVVLEGVVSLKAREAKKKRELTGIGIPGNAYGLSMTSAAAVSGGPVFNGKGQVIGLFVSPPGQKGRAYAVPIKYGRMLLSRGRAN